MASGPMGASTMGTHISRLITVKDSESPPAQITLSTTAFKIGITALKIYIMKILSFGPVIKDVPTSQHLHSCGIIDH